MTNFSKLKNKFEKALKNNFQENNFHETNRRKLVIM